MRKLTTRSAKPARIAPDINRRSAGYYLRRDWRLYLMLLLPVAYYIIFKYIPMYGVTIAFKDYNMFKGINGSPWVGLKFFQRVFKQKEFYRVVRNTLVLNVLDLLFSFPAPILLAVVLSELRSQPFRKLSQTILYLPYFMSWVVISAIALQLFSPDTGIVNILIRRLGGNSIPFLSENNHWIATYVAIGVWQSAGWGSIIFMAAIAGINSELYEAAMIDGAGRFSRIIHVTLPGIRPTIVMMLILRMGSIVTISYEKPYLLGNTIVREVADVISTYVYRVGLEASNFSMATAVGLMQSVIGLILILSSNAIANRMDGSGIF